jgi:hypothetical protein
VSINTVSGTFPRAQVSLAASTAEGLSQPRDFFANVASFSLDDQRKIMVENARSLTFA